MQDFPEPIRRYLKSDDSFSRVQLSEEYPDLSENLSRPETRQSILDWLASDEAWQDNALNFTLNSLEFLQQNANPEEANTIRAFLLHRDRRIRLAAYEYLRVLYYPDKNPEAMLQLLQNMLMDADDRIRSQAARYIKSTPPPIQITDFLQRWLKEAGRRGWESTESYELVQKLLNNN